MEPDAIKLWVFPASDFAAWCNLVGNTNEVADHAGYMAMLAAIQADQERQGRKVERVGMLVADMIARLCDQNLDNTPDNRSLVIAREPPMQWLREWQFGFGIYRPDGDPVSDLVVCD